MARTEAPKQRNLTQREVELNSIVAQCGFIPNPAVTAGQGIPINPPDYEKLDKKLSEWFKANGPVDQPEGEWKPKPKKGFQKKDE
jgi:hypothetical protein